MVPTRILIVDDSRPFRTSLATLLAQHADVQVVGEVESAEGAPGLITQLRPDLLLVDAGLPNLSGFALTHRLKVEATLPRVIVLTLSPLNGYRSAALAAGADDFLGKDDVITTLLPAIRRLFAPPG
jgi:two-component system, NarL family, invasion response regulator UvrY